MAVQAGNEIDTAVVSDVIFLVQGHRDCDGARRGAGQGDPLRRHERGGRGLREHRNGVSPPSPGERPRSGACAMRWLCWASKAVAKEAGLAAFAHGLRVAEAPAPVGDLAGAYGIGFAYGEVTREALLEITQLMRREGIAEASVSPQRALVFPAQGQEKAALAELAKRLGAISDPGDIRLRFHRCPGAPACRRATVEFETARRGRFAGGWPAPASRARSTFRPAKSCAPTSTRRTSRPSQRTATTQ